MPRELNWKLGADGLIPVGLGPPARCRSVSASSSALGATTPPVWKWTSLCMASPSHTGRRTVLARAGKRPGCAGDDRHRYAFFRPLGWRPWGLVKSPETGRPESFCHESTSSRLLLLAL